MVCVLCLNSGLVQECAELIASTENLSSKSTSSVNSASSALKLLERDRKCSLSPSRVLFNNKDTKTDVRGKLLVLMVGGLAPEL